MTAETDAQAAYVEFITNSNAAIKSDKDAVAMKTEQKTQTIADKETSAGLRRRSTSNSLLHTFAFDPFSAVSTTIFASTKN